jgi:hypothetical protein
MVFVPYFITRDNLERLDEDRAALQASVLGNLAYFSDREVRAFNRE